MDAFYVSVERTCRPELRDLPVVIGGAPESRGVVAAASYEARRFGVHSAQPMSQALRLCPDAVRLPPNMTLYIEYSRKVDELLARFTPVVQKVSVDEAYLDMRGTDRLWGPPVKAAETLQGVIMKELDLPCSVGGGANKLIAKIASGQAKPAGICLVAPGEEKPFLDPLPVGVIPGAGEVVRKELANMGIRKIGDLRSLPEEELVREFGKHGAELAKRARGDGSTHLSARGAPKSVSRETTFAKDVDDPGVLTGILAQLLDRAAAALREEGMVAGGLTVKLRYTDFTTPSRSTALTTPTAVDTEMMSAARRLFEELWGRRPEPVRLLGVRLEKLMTEGQMGMFDEPARRWERALDGVDRIRDRYGHKSLRWGRELTGEDAGRAEGDGLQE